MGAPDPIIGTPLFGGYRVSQKIGAGGMGAVYMVENNELNRKLAVKVLLTDRSVSAQTTARFLAEARAASAIHHKNIIDIIDCSKLPDGRHYILMEYLEGMTLRRYNKKRGPLSLEKILSIMVQVCSGLAATHQRGIIHRDLKPSNIFVAPTDENPLFTKVLDFGIAKLEDPLLAGEVKTRSQAIAGTPHYMSPEQARALRDVDQRADVYSVGAIIYELLTGRLPYNAHSIGELVFQQTRTAPQAPHEVLGRVDRKWSDLVMRAIHVDIEKRTPNVVALANEMVEATKNGKKYAKYQAPLLFSREKIRAPSFLPAVETMTTQLPISDDPRNPFPNDALASPFPNTVITADAPFTDIVESGQHSAAEALAAIESLQQEGRGWTDSGTPLVDLEGTGSTIISETQILDERSSTSPTLMTQTVTPSESKGFGLLIVMLLAAIVAAGVFLLWDRSQKNTPSAGQMEEKPLTDPAVNNGIKSEPAISSSSSSVNAETKPVVQSSSVPTGEVTSETIVVEESENPEKASPEKASPEKEAPENVSPEKASPENVPSSQSSSVTTSSKANVPSLSGELPKPAETTPPVKPKPTTETPSTTPPTQ